MTLCEGQVIACHGRRWLVEVDPQSIRSCVSRARRYDIACGDHVQIAMSGPESGVIEAVSPRTSAFFRREGERVKIVAANATLVVIVFAVSPAAHTDLLDRCLAAAEHAAAKVLLVLNKVDISDAGGHANKLRAQYQGLGYSVLELSVDHNIEGLRRALQDHLSVIVGQSGVGKSTLINRLVAGAHARVGEISAGNAKGRHTTTHTRLYRLDSTSAVIDSPGIQVFGLSHIAPADLAHAFVEFRTLIGNCRFANCLHRSEPDCAVAQAACDGMIASQRIESYRRILATITRGAQASTLH